MFAEVGHLASPLSRSSSIQASFTQDRTATFGLSGLNLEENPE